MSIQHPTPNKRSGSSQSTRLLSPHLSVLEALQSTTRADELDDMDAANELENENAAADSEMVSKSIDFTTSWHSIAGDYLAPRPTSSVLSCSDIEENYQDNEEDKTIEINLNDYQQNNQSDSSKFILPQMFESSTSSNEQFFANPTTTTTSGSKDHSKILIIGHKKYNFLQELDESIKSSFTLNNKDNYKICIIIFDGLIKIGNILNYIKINNNSLNSKLFIPIVKNINSMIIKKILTNYKINLFCDPINLDHDQLEWQNLLKLLANEQYLYSSNANINSYQLVRIPSDDSVSSDMDYNYQINEALDFNFYNQINQINPINSISIPLDSQIITTSTTTTAATKNNNQSNKKIVVMKNHPYEITHHTRHNNNNHIYNNHNYHSKKIQSKNRQYRKYFLLAISLTIGIGIGVTTALTISFMKKPPQINHIKPKQSTKLSKLLLNHWKLGESIIKQNLILFKQQVTNWSKLFASLTGELINMKV